MERKEDRAIKEEWFKTKDRLPPHKTPVKARNPHCEAVSWIDGFNELGKPAWCHKTGWEHADDFVTEWRWISIEEGIKCVL